MLPASTMPSHICSIHVATYTILVVPEKLFMARPDIFKLLYFCPDFLYKVQINFTLMEPK
jgi:hypothetical protein